MSSDRFTELDTLLDRWRREVHGNSGADPVPILDGIATILEKETEAYLKLPIDPFDDRHPSRAYPECALGSMLKTLFKNESFMTELTTVYLTSRSNSPLVVVSCRLLLDVLPGLDSSVVFMDSESLVGQLLEWAENADFPLHAYATALLASVMEVPGISASYREQNNHLMPIMFNRLHQLTHGSDDGASTADMSADFIDPRDLVETDQHNRKSTGRCKQAPGSSMTNGTKRGHDQIDSSDESEPAKLVKRGSQVNLMRSPIHNECSSSSWAEAYMSGSYKMNPPNTVMHQRFILQYLASLGEFQELLVHIFEFKAISYILQFIDGRKNQDVRLAFDALKFLASFLTHKKFALEFLDHGGLPHLLRVSRHGMASAGVSLCLYTLAYNEDVMERICWMKTETVDRMVSYGLWLLECSHDSSRAHAALFFSSCFQFPILLDLFDRDSGLRKLLNVISMRGLFNDDPSINELSDDEIYARRQTAKQVTLALKKYTRAHFIRETRSKSRVSSLSNDQECRPMVISDDNFTEAIEQHRIQRQPFNWSAIDRIIDEDLYLLKLIAHFLDESLYTEKAESARNALEVLVVCSLSVRVQRILLKKYVRSNRPWVTEKPAIAIIVDCADPKIDDADCKKSALNVLINLVHAHQNVRAPQLNLSIDSQDPNRPGPSAKTNNDPQDPNRPGTGTKKKNTSRDFPAQLRKAIWDNNGTLILPKLLSISTPLTEADKIRTLACRVLCGLAKEESIRQIMSKLPLFTDGQLQSFMKEPILPEKRLEHALFRNYCRTLIELVTSTPVTSESGIEPSLAEIKRRLVVSRTKITYDEAEANYIIYNHLLSKGYPKIAADFYKAANLGAEIITNPMLRPKSPPLQEPDSGSVTAAPVTPSNKRHAINPNSPGPVVFRNNQKTPLLNSNCNSTSRKSLLMQKSAFQSSHLFKKLSEPSSAPPITLDTIFTDYLRNQHSMCKNPVAICPPFKLLEPHSCPEPTNKLSAPVNIVSRIIRRAVHPPRGGINGAKYDRQYVYSKFRPIRLVRDPLDVQTSSTCCAFSTSGQFLFVGTDRGLLKVFNVSTGLLEASYDCHPTCDLDYIQASKEDNLIITTSSESPTPQCILWTFTDVFERKLRFDNDTHAEFGKSSSERIITTQELYARLWDTETGVILHKFDAYSHYNCNRATLNYSDSLVLNDGVLWDVRDSKTPIHKFPKFNDSINGIFHPNGNEIICNAHIWDIRNFRSLRTVQAFDMCRLKFNSTGDVIFSNLWGDRTEGEAASRSNCEFRTSFRTFDSYDYSTISTIDLKRTISDLAISSNDQYIALIESSEKMRPIYDEYVDSNVCRLYEIGRTKYDPNMDYCDDEESVEEEENDDDDDDDEDDDDEDDEDDDDEDGDGVMAEYDDADYDTDEILDLHDEENTSDSRLSSSVATHSIVSRDEAVPFTFRHSDDEDEDDQQDASTGYDDVDEEDYDDSSYAK